MIGPAGDDGKFFAIFIKEDENLSGRWRAITGRRASPAERDWWERS
jgi:hypothetical protein